MAKTNMIEREKKRAVLAARYAKKRIKLKETIASVAASDADRSSIWR
jgi:small subunit ribosomal protein S14